MLCHLLGCFAHAAVCSLTLNYSSRDLPWILLYYHRTTIICCYCGVVFSRCTSTDATAAAAEPAGAEKDAADAAVSAGVPPSTNVARTSDMMCCVLVRSCCVYLLVGVCVRVCIIIFSSDLFSCALSLRSIRSRTERIFFSDKKREENDMNEEGSSERESTQLECPIQWPDVQRGELKFHL